MGNSPPPSLECIPVCVLLTHLLNINLHPMNRFYCIAIMVSFCRENAANITKNVFRMCLISQLCCYFGVWRMKLVYSGNGMQRKSYSILTVTLNATVIKGLILIQLR